jgi:hypothetical protein
MKLSDVIRAYGGFALSHLQESAIEHGDTATAAMLKEFGAETLHAAADALEATEERREVISKASFVAHEACQMLFHGDMTKEEAVETALEVLRLSEEAVTRQLKKQP